MGGLEVRHPTRPQMRVRMGHPALHAFVVMPEHVHLLLTPAPEVALEKVAQLIKGVFSFRL